MRSSSSSRPRRRARRRRGSVAAAWRRRPGRPRTSSRPAARCGSTPTCSAWTRTTASTSCPTSSGTRSASVTTTGGTTARSQVMHSSSYDALSYRSGDLAGLRFLHDGGPAVPSNDLFASPYLLTEALPTMASGTTTGADREPSEPLPRRASPAGLGVALVDGGGERRGHGRGRVELVRHRARRVPGTTLDGLTEVASNDDGPASSPLSAARFEATAGVTYRIAVDGAAGRARARSRSASDRGRPDRSAPTWPSRSGSTRLPRGRPSDPRRAADHGGGAAVGRADRRRRDRVAGPP